MCRNGNPAGNLQPLAIALLASWDLRWLTQEAADRNTKRTFYDRIFKSGVPGIELGQVLKLVFRCSGSAISCRITVSRWFVDLRFG